MAGIAHYCLHKLRLLPSQFLELDEPDKAFVIASVLKKVEQEKKEAKKLERMKK